MPVELLAGQDGKAPWGGEEEGGKTSRRGLNSKFSHLLAA